MKSNVSTWRELDRRPNTHAWQEPTETGVLTTVRLYDTVIYRRADRLTVLTTGGYETPTTKDRMNAALRVARAGYTVCSIRGAWYAVSASGLRVPFIDGVCRFAE